MDIKEIARRALNQSESLVSSWLPGGKKQGSEWVCGDLSGTPGGSLKVNLRTGKWADFSDNEKGGDLVSLYAAINRIGQKEAADKLSHEVFGSSKSAPPPTEVKLKLVPTNQRPLKSMLNHRERGAPTAYWEYKTADNQTAFFVLRYDYVDTNGKPQKDLLPLSFTDDGRWVKKGWPAPRPIYDLPAVIGSKNVLIVEGEKAAEAAKKFIKSYAVTTWPNGSKAHDKTDWTTIYGKSVLIWPDHDEPGRQAAAKIAAHLLPHCPDIKVIDTSNDDLPVGWDAADAKFTWDEFKVWAKQRAIKVQSPSAPTASVTPAAPTVPTPSVVAIDEPPMPSEVDAPHTTNIMIAGDDAIEAMTHMVSSNVTSNIQRCQLQASNKGIPTENILNISRILTTDFEGKFWFDEFRRSFMTSVNGEAEALHDTHIFNFQAILQSSYGLRKVAKGLVTDAITAMSYQDRRNEAKDYFQSLKWDGLSRMEDFFCNAYGAADTKLNQAISKYFFASIMARFFGRDFDLIYGNKVDSMVVIEGDQGIAKGMGLKHLIGEKWHYEASKDIKDKDFFQDMKGKIIAEIAELDVFDRQGVKTLRRVLTCQVDRLRVSYGRESEDFDRACIFVGTTNETEYLEDDKGNRRFLPITATKVDINYIRDNREQLFAEALVYYRENVHHWWSMPKDLLKAEHSKRMVQTVADEYTSYIAEYLARPSCGEVSVPDIWVNCFKQELGRITQKNRNDIAQALRHLGYENRVERDKQLNKAVRVWAKPHVRVLPPDHH